MKKMWKINILTETKEELLEQIDEEDSEDLSDYGETEISVIKSDRGVSIDSCGWNSLDKIILFDESDLTKKQFEWCKKVAEIIANTLNENNL